jgi:hypothetical protein
MLFICIMGLLGLVITAFCGYKIMEINDKKKAVYRFYAQKKRDLKANSVSDLDNPDDLDLFLDIPPIEIHELNRDEDFYYKAIWVGLLPLGLVIFGVDWHKALR